MKNLLATLIVLVVVSAVGKAEADTNLIRNSTFDAGPDGKPAGWSSSAVRPEIAPESRVVADGTGRGLLLKARNFSSFGKWSTAVLGVDGGKTYRFEVMFRPEQVENLETSVAAILSWFKDPEGRQLIRKDYADGMSGGVTWMKIFRTLEAPAECRSVRVELVLRWSAAGSVLWKEPRLVEVSAKPHRTIRVVTTHLEPPSPSTLQRNLELMGAMVDRASVDRPDLILFSETVATERVSLAAERKAQSIPGPITDALGKKAKQHHTYIATSVLELDGGLHYNTAVLIDRDGRVAGKYRKVHLAMGEGAGGVTPGSEYPVFDTDFGKVGMMICWDNWFPETARILRLKGAEVLLWPFQGDANPRYYPHHLEAVSRTRAIDNGVYLITSGIVSHSASRIVDPLGEFLAETSEPMGIASAVIDLDRQDGIPYLSVGPGLGEPRSLYIKERRPETYGSLIK